MANKDFQNGFIAGLAANEGTYKGETIIEQVPQVQTDWEQNDSEAVDYIKNRPFYREGNAPFTIEAFSYGNKEEAFGFVEGEQYKIEYLFDDNTTLVRYSPAISLEDTYDFKGPAVFDIYYYDEKQTSFDNDNHLYFFLIDNAYVNDDGYPVPEEGKAITLVDNRIRDPQEPYKNLVSATIYVSKTKKIDVDFLPNVVNDATKDYVAEEGELILASAKDYTDKQIANSTNETFVVNKIGEHNTSVTSHKDIREELGQLKDKINNFLDMGTDFDTISEILNFITSNSGNIATLLAGKVNYSDIVDSLESDATNKPLSAARGKYLKELVDAIDEEIKRIDNKEINYKDIKDTPKIPVNLSDLVNDVNALTTSNVSVSAGAHINEAGTPTVNKTVEENNITLTFDYLKGEKGEKGDPGTPGLPGLDGEKGEKGDDGAPGKDGADGKDGKDGQDGVTPTILVEAGEEIDNPDEAPTVEVRTEGTTSTFIFNHLKGNQGEQGMPGVPGMPGQDGRGITAAAIDDNGELTLTYSDNTSETLGKVVGENGQDGQDGENGQDGKDGKDGEKGDKGDDGLSVTHEWDGTTLVITSASGTSSMDLKGESGEIANEATQEEKGLMSAADKKKLDDIPDVYETLVGAQTKANKALEDAKAYTNEEITKIEKEIPSIAGLATEDYVKEETKKVSNSLDAHKTQTSADIAKVREDFAKADTQILASANEETGKVSAALETFKGSVYTKSEIDGKTSAINTSIQANTNSITSLDGKVTTNTNSITEINTKLTNKADLKDGLILSSQLPSYVDDVIEAYIKSGATTLSSTWLVNEAGTAITPEKGKIYLVLSSGEHLNRQYRWSGTTYVLCNPSDVNSVNGKTGIVTLSASEVGAVPTSRKVNDKELKEDISLTASDVGAVPTSRKVNGKALSTDITLTANDVGADASGSSASALQNAKNYTDEKVNGIQIGDKNLILASGKLQSSTGYQVASYQLSEDWVPGQVYTLIVKGQHNSSYFGFYRDSGWLCVATISTSADNNYIASKTFTCPAKSASDTDSRNNILTVYNQPNNVSHNSSISWIKLVKGNVKLTDWTPAPEDRVGQIDYSQGKMLHRDPIFKTSLNECWVYNNAQNGTVTVSRTARSSDNPFTDSNYELTITNTGSAAPLCGGFAQNFNSRANARFICRIVAKIPVGRNISYHSNNCGNGAYWLWHTSTAGTGKFEEYIIEIVCGSSGTFQTGGFYALTGTVGTTSTPVKWYVAYSTCYDMTNEGDVLDILAIANTAQTTATEAKTLATTANTNATNASTAASTAQSTANTANTNASSAVTTANTANSTANTANATANTALSRVTIKDTRNDNQNPQWYMANYPFQVVEEFKYASTIGLSGETYCYLETIVPWNDASGGYPKQIAYIDNKIYNRVGTSNTAWGSWTTSSNIMTGATSSAAGTKGLVPAPSAGYQSSFLRGDGTWATPANNWTRQYSTSNNAEYPLLFGYNANQSSDYTGSTRFDSGVTLNPSTNTIKGASLDGAAKTLTGLTTSIEDLNKLDNSDLLVEDAEEVEILQGVGRIAGDYYREVPGKLGLTIGQTYTITITDADGEVTTNSFTCQAVELIDKDQNPFTAPGIVYTSGSVTLTYIIDGVECLHNEELIVRAGNSYLAIILLTDNDVQSVVISGPNLKARIPRLPQVVADISGNASSLHGLNLTGSELSSALDGLVGQKDGNGEIFNDYSSNIANGNDSHAEGYYTRAYGDYCHTEGRGTVAGRQNETYNYQACHAEGYDTIASGNRSHAEGSNTEATGAYSHAEGVYTDATGKGSHAEGYYTVASGDYSHAEGRDSEATKTCAHAEGYNTNATGIYAHAEGTATTASGEEAHAEGSNTTASGNYSHSEGYAAKATAYGSHAQNSGTTASGGNSHAEGYYTTASGAESHAEGIKTIAKGATQHVQGKFNIEDTANKYAHIVGNGEDGARSNCHTLDWNGVGWFAGGIGLGGSQDAYLDLTPQTIEVTMTDPATTKYGYAHTPNIDDSGTQDGYYTDSYTDTQVVTIEGATTLNVTITYQTESTNYDWVCIFQGAHSDYTAETTGYLYKLGGSTKTTATYTISGDSVTFAFRSDGSQCSYYGYYAVVSATVSNSYTTEMLDGISTANNFYIGGDLYIGGENNEDAQQVAAPVYITVNNTSGSFSGGHTYQSIINLINSGIHVILVYARTSGVKTYYSFVEKADSSYYFSSPKGYGYYLYRCTLTSSSISFYTTYMDYVYGSSTTSNTNYPVALKTAASNGYVYVNSSIYGNPSTGYLYAKSHVTSSADYAEYYEWEDGNPNNEDRRGHFVTLSSGDKIRFATSEDDYILGVVSVSPAVLGNDYDAEWKGKYLTDVFGKVLTKEVFVEEYTNEETGEIIPAHMETIPILNPEYDESQEYISREKRKEWVPIGTHGQLILIDNGLCEVGKYCMPGEDGTAVPSNQKEYRIIERLDENHIKIVIK